MTSLHEALDALKAVAVSLLRQFEKNSKTSHGLQSLYDATGSIQIALRDPAFRKRSDAGRLVANIDDLTKIATSNLEDLQILIHPNRDRRTSANRSPQSEADETVRNQSIFSNLQKHTSAFQRLGDYMADREDWSKLAPKPPRAPSASPDSGLRLQPVESNRSNTSGPHSPYVTTVEEIDDVEPDPKEEVRSNVEHVYYVRNEEPSPTRPVQPTTPVDAEATKTNPRRVAPPQTPPQFVLRQPTDPTQFESTPKKRPDFTSSPLRNPSGPDDDSDDSDHFDEELKPGAAANFRPSALPKILTKVEPPASNSVKEIEDEIARLNHELQKMSGTDTSTSDSARPELGRRKRSGKHRSVDLGRTDSLPPESAGGNLRARALSSQNPERPKSFIDTTSYDMPPPPRPDVLRRTSSQKSRRPPSRSPRMQSYTAVEGNFNDLWDHNYPQSANDAFGPDPRASLPTVLESAGPRSNRSNRSMRAFEDSRDNFGYAIQRDDGGLADFPLFPTSSQTPQSAHPGSRSRSRGNSRAKQDASPNAKPYISPHQLHDSLPIEPDVREISVTLEDVFYGCVKRCKVRRDRFNPATGVLSKEERILDVPISRGLKSKSKIQFAGEGHQTPDGIRELHFQLAEKPHQMFSRVDYDLHCTIEITLSEALCGWEKSVTSICGTQVRFSHRGPTPATWRDDRAGLGMCTFKNPENRGDLIASVSIRLPGAPLSEAQKRLIRQALDMGVSPRSSGNFFP